MRIKVSADSHSNLYALKKLGLDMDKFPMAGSRSIEIPDEYEAAIKAARKEYWEEHERQWKARHGWAHERWNYLSLGGDPNKFLR